MTRHLHDIESIHFNYAQRLIDQGISTTEKLLQECVDTRDIKSLAEATRIHESLILKWVKISDLLRINLPINSRNY